MRSIQKCQPEGQLFFAKEITDEVIRGDFRCRFAIHLPEVLELA
jgi:hypothetical protein